MSRPQPDSPDTGLREILMDLAMSDFITESRAMPRVDEAIAAIEAYYKKLIPEKQLYSIDDAEFEQWQKDHATTLTPFGAYRLGKQVMRDQTHTNFKGGR